MNYATRHVFIEFCALFLDYSQNDKQMDYVFQNRKVILKDFNKCDKMIIVCPELFISRITDEDLRTGAAFTNAGHKNGHKNGDKQSNDSCLLCETKAAQHHSAYSLQLGSVSYLSKRVI